MNVEFQEDQVETLKQIYEYLGIDKSRYCEFHNKNGHNTEERIQMMSIVEDPIGKGSYLDFRRDNNIEIRSSKGIWPKKN